MKSIWRFLQGFPLLVKVNFVRVREVSILEIDAKGDISILHEKKNVRKEIKLCFYCFMTIFCKIRSFRFRNEK